MKSVNLSQEAHSQLHPKINEAKRLIQKQDIAKLPSLMKEIEELSGFVSITPINTALILENILLTHITPLLLLPKSRKSERSHKS